MVRLHGPEQPGIRRMASRVDHSDRPLDHVLRASSRSEVDASPDARPLRLVVSPVPMALRSHA